MPKITVAFPITNDAIREDGARYANRSTDKILSILRGFPETRWKLRTVEVPNDAETICALVEDPLRVIGQLQTIKEQLLYINASGQVKRD